MKVREGIGFNIHNGFTGIDPHTKFDVVTREFRAMAKEEVRYWALLSIS
jgi:hypothetical protein